MVLRNLFLMGFVAMLFLTEGCSTVLQATKVPGVDLSRLKTFYVQRLPADERGIEQLIAKELTKTGYVSSFGSEETPSSLVDAIVTYQDKWMWDITMYMLQLSIQIRDGKDRTVLATGQSLRPSLVRKSPEGMVEEVLGEIFKGAKG
jgi:hypothetical protein